MLIATSGYTNMAWPDDPYGTGQLWRKEPLLLAGFAIRWVDQPGRPAPVCYAVAYLRLSRAGPVDLNSGAHFGFRAVVAAAASGTGELVRLLDLDAMRARRLAKVVAGGGLIRDLRAIEPFTTMDTRRGIRSLAGAIETAGPLPAGFAELFDVLDHTGGSSRDLSEASASVGISVPATGSWLASQQAINVIGDRIRQMATSPDTAARNAAAEHITERLAADATGRAVLCALIAGQILGRCTWEDTLDLGAVMAENSWDQFPSLDFADPLPTT